MTNDNSAVIWSLHCFVVGFDAESWSLPSESKAIFKSFVCEYNVLPGGFLIFEVDAELDSPRFPKLCPGLSHK